MYGMGIRRESNSAKASGNRTQKNKPRALGLTANWDLSGTRGDDAT